MKTNLDTESIIRFVKHKQDLYQTSYVIANFVFVWIIAIINIFIATDPFGKILSLVLFFTLNPTATVAFILYVKKKTLLHQNLYKAITYLIYAFLSPLLLFYISNMTIQIDHSKILLIIILFLASMLIQYIIIIHKIKNNRYTESVKFVDQQLAGGVVGPVTYLFIKGFGDKISQEAYAISFVLFSLICLLISFDGFVKFYFQKKYSFNVPIKIKKSEWLEPDQ